MRCRDGWTTHSYWYGDFRSTLLGVTEYWASLSRGVPEFQAMVSVVVYTDVNATQDSTPRTAARGHT